ncbi:MAG: transglycosylase domain-containing protein [Thiovulaceae bacterium]|nr:transglycosylase domain-containing protein [Sulfurimonadaceae bacterium]
MKKILVAFVVVGGLFFALWHVQKSLTAFPVTLESLLAEGKKQHFYDRNGVQLNTTYANRYNTVDLLELHELPELLKEALLFSEDKNFFEHGGVDWGARARAMWQNIRAFTIVSGASTITEQTVRIIHPRPRTFYSRFLEGFDALVLEKKFSKAQVLEFYCNQVPFGAKRKGFKQAARYYFNRDVDTLSDAEMLSLVVLIRSPKWYDPLKHAQKLKEAVDRLAKALHAKNKLSSLRLDALLASDILPSAALHEVEAGHFLRYVTSRLDVSMQNAPRIYTTLDSFYQDAIQKALNTKLRSLVKKNVQNGAVLVLDHRTNEVVAWVVGFAGEEKPFTMYDPILVARQPGSTLKPFLYASAIEKGWEADTLIDDSPLNEGIGSGTHGYHNYSNRYYGEVSVREALGNSLNIPAIKTIRFVGVKEFLGFLRRFGVESLTKHPNYYGDGIAIGNSEVTLFELTRAYAALARMGSLKDVSVLENEAQDKAATRVLSEDIASLMGDILSDASARAKEFGWNSILNFSHQSGVKTGTSNDYRDAWTFAYDDTYCVGVWFGNLDFSRMDKVTGSSGPAEVARNVLAMLSQNRDPKPLFISPNLTKVRLEKEGKIVDEYRVHGVEHSPKKEEATKVRIKQPSKNLIMAKDPRIPDAYERYNFEIEPIEGAKIEWYLNDTLLGTTDKPFYSWHVKQGKYELRVKAIGDTQILQSDTIKFEVH